MLFINSLEICSFSISNKNNEGSFNNLRRIKHATVTDCVASHLSESLVYFVVLLFHQENHILKPFNALLTNFEMEKLSLLHVKATFDDMRS